MTYIEFCDKASIVNICGCLTNLPDRVVLIGGDIKPMLRKKELYEKLFSNRGQSVEFIAKSVNKNSLQEIVRVITETVETYNDCILDLTGGEDLMLVAAGIVYERRHLQMHRFNVYNNKIYDCDGDGVTVEKDFPRLSFEENVLIYGGRVVFDNERSGATHRWDMSGDFIRDIDTMWEICRINPKNWNTQTGVFAAAELFRRDKNTPLTTSAEIDKVVKYLKSNGAKYILHKSFLNKLKSSGLIEYALDGERISVTYKNEQVKRCLTKAGLALEMKIYSVMSRLTENGEKLYDTLTGVVIDWDGIDGKINTENEIDVAATCGMVPVFISCKNGWIDIDELYKLNSVAGRFGSKFAKKVLVASNLERGSAFASSFLTRADDMGIAVIDNAASLTDAELEKRLRGIWR